MQLRSKMQDAIQELTLPASKRQRLLQATIAKKRDGEQVVGPKQTKQKPSNTVQNAPLIVESEEKQPLLATPLTEDTECDPIAKRLRTSVCTTLNHSSEMRSYQDREKLKQGTTTIATFPPNNDSLNKSTAKK